MEGTVPSDPGAGTCGNVKLKGSSEIRGTQRWELAFLVWQTHCRFCIQIPINFDNLTDFNIVYINIKN